VLFGEQGLVGVGQVRPAAMQAKEGVLHHVFRGWLVTEQKHREADQSRSVRLVERRELADGSGRGLAAQEGVHAI
jgi:hypothetical protein